MPVMDGIDLTGLIRQTPGYRHKPVLMLTAMEDKDYLDGPLPPVRPITSPNHSTSSNFAPAFTKRKG